MLRKLARAALVAPFFSAFVAVAADEVVRPNSNLHVEGIPPIPANVAARAEKYTEFRPRTMVDWHPTAREVVVACRLGATTQLYRVREPKGALEALTDYPDPVREATYQPKQGRFLVFSRDSGGNEATQLYRLQPGASAQPQQLTDPQYRHAQGPWNHKGDRLVMISTPLDKA